MHMNPNQRHLRIGCIRVGALLVLLHIVGCSSAPLVTRPVQTESTWFVRLDTYQEPEKSRALQYDHPVEWNEPELATILSPLLLQPEMGLLDRKRPPVPVFSAEELARLTPILRAAFQQAQAVIATGRVVLNLGVDRVSAIYERGVADIRRKRRRYTT